MTTMMMTMTMMMMMMTTTMTNCDSVQFDLWGLRGLPPQQVPPSEGLCLSVSKHRCSSFPPAPLPLPLPLQGPPGLILSGAEPLGLPLGQAAPAGTQHRCKSCLLSKDNRNLQGICPQCPRAGGKCLPARCQRDTGSQFVFSMLIGPALNIQRPNLTSRHREGHCKV